jgi:hypothetical protein
VNRRPVAVVVLLVALCLATIQAAEALESVAAELTPVAGSGVAGTARVIAKGGVLTVVWELRGAAPGRRYAGFVYRGRCPNGHPEPRSAERPVLDLSTSVGERPANPDGTIGAGADRIGALADVADGAHVVAIHDTSGAWPGLVVACGEIPAATIARQLPRTGAPAAATTGALGLVVTGLGLLVRRGRAAASDAAAAPAMDLAAN